MKLLKIEIAGDRIFPMNARDIALYFEYFGRTFRHVRNREIILYSNLDLRRKMGAYI